FRGRTNGVIATARLEERLLLPTSPNPSNGSDKSIRTKSKKIDPPNTDAQTQTKEKNRPIWGRPFVEEAVTAMIPRYSAVTAAPALSKQPNDA
ncbi:MAG: hypothetical protein VX127_09685, partial [Myxococcota bacterium]|nr:hypothetical protein [Myxococcota bacterium]